MYKTPINFHNRLMRGEVPIVYIVIQTLMGYRAYAEKELRDVFGILRLLADGSVVAGGDETAGSESLGIFEKSARILNMGGFERTIQPRSSSVLAAYTSKQKQHLSVTLDNADGHFSRLLPKEPFLGREMKTYVGFEETPQSEHLNIFCGTISEIDLDDKDTMILEADEK